MPLKSTIIKFVLSLGATIALIVVLILMFNLLKKENELASKLSIDLNEHISDEDGTSALGKTINNTKDIKDRLNSYVVNENHIDKFVSWVEDLGDSIKVPITVTNVSSLPTKKNIISLSLKGRGSFSDVIRFVSLVENAPYQIKIKSVFLNKVPDDKTSTTPAAPWEVQLEFDVVSNKFTN